MTDNLNKWIDRTFSHRKVRRLIALMAAGSLFLGVLLWVVSAFIPTVAANVAQTVGFAAIIIPIMAGIVAYYFKLGSDEGRKAMDANKPPEGGA